MSLPRFDKTGETLWRSGLRSESVIETERAALEAFDDAVALAREGDFQSARQLCVVVVFLIQPLLPSRAALLKATLHALLVSHGFSLLSRVVTAMNGRKVDVTMLPECIGKVEEPRRNEEARRTDLLVDPRWLARLSPEDGFLRDWCDTLAGGTQTGTIRSGQPLDQRLLERI